MPNLLVLLGLLILPLSAVADTTALYLAPPLSHSELTGITLIGVGFGYTDDSGLGGELELRINKNSIVESSSGVQITALAVYDGLLSPPDPGFWVSTPFRLGLGAYSGQTPDVFEHESWSMTQTTLVADLGIACHWGDFVIRSFAGVAQPLTTDAGKFETHEDGYALDGTRFRWHIDLGLTF